MTIDFLCTTRIANGNFFFFLYLTFFLSFLVLCRKSFEDDPDVTEEDIGEEVALLK